MNNHIKLGCNMGLIQYGYSLIEYKKEYKLGCHYLVLAYNQRSDMLYITKFDIIDTISKYKEILWNTELHKYWLQDISDLNLIVITLLLISKYRRQSNSDIVKTVMIRGITINVIKYYCHNIIINN
jgi:hypothetical protein